MLKFTSPGFTVSIQEGVLQVFYNKARELSVTHVDENGCIEELTVNRENADKSESKLLASMNKMPAFSATYQGKGEWDCDIDAGFQRWRGYKSGKAVGIALKQCGFNATEISSILKTARKHVGTYCPRQW